MSQLPRSGTESVGGEVLASHNRRPEAYASGRRCRHGDCVTLLSIYNSDDFCAVHASSGAEARDAARSRSRVRN